MTECIFCRIASGEMGTELLYEDEHVVAFADLNPQAPTHILLIPRRHITHLLDAEDGDTEILGRLLRAAGDIAREQGLGERGFRIVSNTLEEAGQSVFHLHVHLLGGRTMGWPPG